MTSHQLERIYLQHYDTYAPCSVTSPMSPLRIGVQLIQRTGYKEGQGHYSNSRAYWKRCTLGRE
eukprot:7645823-Pyramimonas_sp.AAC.1